MVTKVKICGITSIEDALHAAAAGADAIGLNFCAGSPRCVGVELAAEIAAALPEGVRKVGVFVDMPRAEVQRIAEHVGLDALQFHGNEEAEFCTGWQWQTIKAVRVRDGKSLARAPLSAADLILADAFVDDRPGGTGHRIPVEWLVGVPADRLILAGGLTPDNVAEAIRAVQPMAVDVASGVERAPGVKDAEKVEWFIANARTA